MTAFLKGDKVRVVPTPYPGLEAAINLTKGTWDRLAGRAGEVDAIRVPTHFFPSGMVHVVFTSEAWWLDPAYLRKGDPVGIVFVEEEGALGAPEG